MVLIKSTLFSLLLVASSSALVQSSCGRASVILNPSVISSHGQRIESAKNTASSDLSTPLIKRELTELDPFLTNDSILPLTIRQSVASTISPISSDDKASLTPLPVVMSPELPIGLPSVVILDVESSTSVQGPTFISTSTSPSPSPSLPSLSSSSNPPRSSFVYRNLKVFGSKVKSGLGSTGSFLKSGYNSTGSILKNGYNTTGCFLKSGYNTTSCILKSGYNTTGSFLKSGFDSTGSMAKSGFNQTELMVKSGLNQTGAMVQSGINQTGVMVQSGANHVGEFTKSALNYTSSVLHSSAHSANQVLHSAENTTKEVTKVVKNMTISASKSLMDTTSQLNVTAKLREGLAKSGRFAQAAGNQTVLTAEKLRSTAGVLARRLKLASSAFLTSFKNNEPAYLEGSISQPIIPVVPVPVILTSEPAPIADPIMRIMPVDE